MLVKDIMSRHPPLIEADATIRKAAEHMSARRARILVVRDGGQIAGVVTDRDLALRPAEGSQSYDTASVRDVMTPEAHAVRHSSPIAKAASAMKKKSIWNLLVVDDEARLVGLLSLADVALKEPIRGLACEVLGHLAANPKERDVATQAN